jgi:hypothetical protein
MNQTNVTSVKYGIQITYDNGEWSFWTLDEMNEVVKTFNKAKREARNK